MNTGENLSSLSGLPSGTAMEHFLAVRAGLGGTVFASRFSVVTSEEQTVVTRRGQRKAPAPVAKPAAPSLPKSAGQKSAYATASTLAISTYTTSNDLFVTSRQRKVFAAQKFDTATVTKKASKA